MNIVNLPTHKLTPVFEELKEAEVFFFVNSDDPWLATADGTAVNLISGEVSNYIESDTPVIPCNDVSLVFGEEKEE